MLYYEGSTCLIENFLLNLQVYKILCYFILLTKKHSLSLNFVLCGFKIKILSRKHYWFYIEFMSSVSVYIAPTGFSESLTAEKGIFLPEGC